MKPWPPFYYAHFPGLAAGFFCVYDAGVCCESHFDKEGHPKMTNRIMFRANTNENTISIRTYTPRMKSPQHFYICYSEFDRLQRDGSIITSDIHSFAQLRLDEKHDRISFDFTWLSGHCHGRVEGFEQAIDIRWSKFKQFLDTCRQPDGPKTFKAISLEELKCRPKLVFDGNKANLRAAISNPHIRHKLGKALAANFNWPYTDEVHLYSDFVPFSFVFREFRDGQALMCGGLILHGQEDMSRAYYGIHT